MKYNISIIRVYVLLQNIFTKTRKVDFLEENKIWEVLFWRVMTNVCVLARFAVLLVITKPCFASPCNANDMCLFLPHWCPITLWTFRQKAHTHVGTNLFTMFDANKHCTGFCLGQMCTTMIALSARLRLLSVWRSQWTILLYYSQP